MLYQLSRAGSHATQTSLIGLILTLNETEQIVANLTEALFVNSSLHSLVSTLCSAWEIAYKVDSNCQARSKSQQSRTSKEPERPETTKEEAIFSSPSKRCSLPCQWAVSQSCPCKVSACPTYKHFPGYGTNSNTSSTFTSQALSVADK